MNHRPLPSFPMLVSMIIGISLIMGLTFLAEEATKTDYRKQAVEECNRHFGEDNWHFIDVVEQSPRDSETWICQNNQTGAYYEPMLIDAF